MKVLQINSVIDYGSTGRIARDMYDYLVSNGNECIIAFGRGKSTYGYKTYKIGSKIGQLLHVVFSRLTDRHGFGSKLATLLLIQKIRKIKPDIIQLHNLHGYYLNINILFKFLSDSNIPVVWLLHDQWAISGHSANFNLNIDGSIPTKLSDRDELMNYPKTIGISQFSKNLSDKKELFTSLEKMTIVTPSDWLNNIISKSFLNKYNIRTIHNGVNTSVFKVDWTNNHKYRKQWLAENKIVILGVASNWNDRKGLNDFIELADKLSAEKYQIVLVGIDSRNEQSLPQNIISINRTNSVDELREIYNASDIFVNLTYFDNFPTVNIEALACGTPIITYNTGGSPESIDKRTGTVIRQGDINQLVTEINFWGQKTKKTSEDCNIRAKTFFSEENVYKEYIKLYENLLNNK